MAFIQINGSYFQKKRKIINMSKNLPTGIGGTIAFVFNGFARWDQNFNVFLDIYFLVTDISIWYISIFQCLQKTSYKTIINNTGVYMYMIKKLSNKTMLFFLFSKIIIL